MADRTQQLEKTALDRLAALIGQWFHRQGQGQGGIAGARKRLGDLERGLAAAFARRHVPEERTG
jgi:hypothetical protein